MKKLLFALITLFWTSLAFSAPDQPVVTGTVADEQTITIGCVDGTCSFGNGPTVDVFETFDETGKTAGTFSTTTGPRYGTWGSLPSGASSSMQYYSGQSVSGNYSGRVVASIYYRNRAVFANTTEVFASYWVQIPPGTCFPGGTTYGVYPTESSWKLTWLFRDGNQNYNGLCIPTMVGAGSWKLDGNNIQLGYISSFGFKWGIWQRITLHIRADPDNPSTANGTYWLQTVNATDKAVVKKTGTVPIFGTCSASPGCSAPYYWNNLDFTGWSRNSSCNEPVFDDIYLATGAYSRAHVEIGDSPTYANCSKLFILTPEEWTTNSITATVNQGFFSANETAYLFVVDSDGGVSPASAALTIGGTSADTTAPTVDNYSPTKSYTDAPTDVGIIARISDGGSGVNVDTIQVDIEGANHCCSQMVGTCPDAGTKDLLCYGTSAAAITFTKSDNAFSPSQVVNVSIDASDLDGNAMAADTYSFTVTAGTPEADTTDPAVAITSPTALAYYVTTDSATSFAGTSSDNVALASPAVAWSNSQGGSGNAAGSTSWSVDVLPLTASTFGSTLATNGTFDSDTANWTANNATLTQGEYGSRTNCLSVADDGIWSEAVQTITVESGELYVITALVYSAGTDISENGSIILDLAGARTDTWGNLIISGPGVSNQWTTIRGIIQASGTSLTVRLHSEEASSAYFDNVVVRKVTAANVITVTATDTSANTATDTLTIVYDPPAAESAPPSRVMVQDANGRTWVYDAAGVHLVQE